MLHGTSGLELAYTLVLAGMIAALIQERAPLARALLSPFVAVGVTVLVGLGVALLALPFKLLTGLVGIVQILCSGLLMVVSGYAAGRILATGELGPKEMYRRGAVLLEKLQAPALADFRKELQPGTVTLAGIAVPREDEMLHFKLIGTTGTGKSTGVHEILRAPLGRGDRAVIADPDGGYIQRFYDPGRDAILSPFWPGACKWDLFAEVRVPQDIEQISRALIASAGGGDPFWVESARTFFGAVAQSCLSTGRDPQVLYHLLTSAPLEELRSVLAGTRAAPLVADGNERMFGSVRSVAIASLLGFDHLVAQRGALLSVRQWVRSGKGVLFMPYKAGEIASLKMLIATWIRLAIFEAMDAPEGDQRLWFVVDELDALGKIDGLQDALARLRKFGGRCILGFQSIGQVVETYGRAAHAMVENCANTLILRCSASDRGGTSEYASRLIGQREVTRPVSSYRGWLGWLNRSVSLHTQVELAVLPSEIERLPKLHGFLKLASSPDWMRVQLTPRSGPATHTDSACEGGPDTTMPSPPEARSPKVEPSPSPPAPTGQETSPSAAAAAQKGRGAPRGRRRAAAQASDPAVSGQAAEQPSAGPGSTSTPDGTTPEAAAKTDAGNSRSPDGTAPSGDGDLSHGA
jgi:hypothetical protein